MNILAIGAQCGAYLPLHRAGTPFSIATDRRLEHGHTQLARYGVAGVTKRLDALNKVTDEDVRAAVFATRAPPPIP
jgi:hypothetical protein